VLRADQDLTLGAAQFERITRLSTKATRSRPRPILQERRRNHGSDRELNARRGQLPASSRNLAETRALLRRAATAYAPVTQASSLGAEDVVITHSDQQR
jgi:hypothetical protein